MAVVQAAQRRLEGAQAQNRAKRRSNRADANGSEGRGMVPLRAARAMPNFIREGARSYIQYCAIVHVNRAGS